MDNLVVRQDCVPKASHTIVYKSYCSILGQVGRQQELTFRRVMK